MFSANRLPAIILQKTNRRLLMNTVWDCEAQMDPDVLYIIKSGDMFWRLFLLVSYLYQQSDGATLVHL